MGIEWKSYFLIKSCLDISWYLLLIPPAIDDDKLKISSVYANSRLKSKLAITQCC